MTPLLIYLVEIKTHENAKDHENLKLISANFKQIDDSFSSYLLMVFSPRPMSDITHTGSLLRWRENPAVTSSRNGWNDMGQVIILVILDRSSSWSNLTGHHSGQDITMDWASSPGLDIIL